MDYPNLFVLILSTALLMSACDSEGIVGSKFVDGGSNLTANTVAPEKLNALSEEGYTGRLLHMAIGEYQDPVFGMIHTTGLLKPAILSSTVSSIGENETLKLQMVFSSDVYGDTTSQASYDIFRVSEYWRGSELRYGDDISWDSGDLVGSFTASHSDTVFVDLDPAWVADYNEYLESDDEDKSAQYRNSFFGLAVVPSSGGSQILFPRMMSTSGQESNNTDFVRFVIESDDDEEEELQYLPVLDWGMVLTRIPETVQVTDTYRLHSMLESFLEVDPGLTEEKLGSNNIANVDFVLYQDTETLINSLPAGHVRPEVERARIHFITGQDKSDFIFSNAPSLVAVRDTVDNSFRFDLTALANTILYGTIPEGDYYLSIESINGLIYSTLFHSETAAEAVRPKIIISTINKPDY